MANPFYVTIKGKKQGQIEGECAQKGLEKKIVGFAYEQGGMIPIQNTGVEAGRATGRRVYQPLVLRKHVDKATPKLWQALATGEGIETVTIDFYRIDDKGKNTNYYSITLENALITEIKNSIDIEDTSKGGGRTADELSETVSFSFAKIKWDHKGASIAAEDDVLDARTS